MRKLTNWKKETGFSARFWALYSGVSRETIYLKLLGKKIALTKPAKYRHITTETGFSGYFWAAWSGVCYSVVMKHLRQTGNTMKDHMARSKHRQPWCIALAKETGITIFSAAKWGSREQYWTHRLIKDEYHAARMHWNWMEQQWGKAEWKASEVRKARERKRHRNWLVKCKAEGRRFLIGKRLRGNINHRLRKKIKRGLSASGFADFETMKTVQHIERQFKRGMTWDTWGKDWEIDHIIALAKFDLRNPQQVRQANHWTNLRPLWKADNRRKGAKGGGQLHLVL